MRFGLTVAAVLLACAVASLAINERQEVIELRSDIGATDSTKETDVDLGYEFLEEQSLDATGESMVSNAANITNGTVAKPGLWGPEETVCQWRSDFCHDTFYRRLRATA